MHFIQYIVVANISGCCLKQPVFTCMQTRSNSCTTSQYKPPAGSPREAFNMKQQQEDDGFVLALTLKSLTRLKSSLFRDKHSKNRASLSFC